MRPYRGYWKLKITLHFSLDELLELSKQSKHREIIRTSAKQEASRTPRKVVPMPPSPQILGHWISKSPHFGDLGGIPEFMQESP